MIEIYKIDPAAANDLIYSLDGKKKVELLFKLAKTKNFSENTIKCISELRYSFEKFKSGRNLYAHGAAMFNENDDSRHIGSLRGNGESPDELPLRFEQAKYAAYAGVQLLRSLSLLIPFSGQQHSVEGELAPWPDRPSLKTS